MKIVLLMLLVAGWMHLPAEGYLFENYESLVKRSSEVEADASNGMTCAPTITSKFVKSLLSGTIGNDGRLFLGIVTSTPEDLEDESFKRRYNITDVIIEMVHNIIKTNKKIRTLRGNLPKFYPTKTWKSLMSLSAATEDLLDPSYRAKWSLGELSESVTKKAREYSGGDNFFCSPQWSEAIQQDPETFKYTEPDEFMGVAVGWYFKNLIDTIDKMSEEDH